MAGKEDGEEKDGDDPRPPALLQRTSVGLVLGPADLRIHHSHRNLLSR
jgi:hypothetical protein